MNDQFLERKMNENMTQCDLNVEWCMKWYDIGRAKLGRGLQMTKNLLKFIHISECPFLTHAFVELPSRWNCVYLFIHFNSVWNKTKQTKRKKINPSVNDIRTFSVCFMVAYLFFSFVIHFFSLLCFALSDERNRTEKTVQRRV